jgi:acetyl esterase/lipase
MYKLFASIFLSLCFFVKLPGQSCQQISLTPIYPCVDTTKNIQYGQGRHDYFFPDPANGCVPFEPLFADVFRPCVGNEAPRPLVIFIHGGAFAAGNKADFWAQCDAFARRGYVAATIQYRLSVNLLTMNRHALIRAGYRAQQDAKAAIRFFKAHADEYNVDTSNVYLVGYSAGAITALNVVYARDEDERPAEANFDGSCGYWFGCPICPDLGTLEGEGGNPDFSSRVKGIYALAGAVMDMPMIDETDDTPVAMIHGTADQTVDYDSACFLNLIPCPKLYGSHSIQQRAEALGLCTQLHTVPGAGHDLTPYMDTIVEEASAFFYKLVCEGNPCAVSSVAEENFSTLKAYPNPAGDWVRAEVKMAAGGTLQLFNLTGDMLVLKNTATGTPEELTVPLAGLPPGMYFLQWRSAFGNKIQTARIVKQ